MKLAHAILILMLFNQIETFGQRVSEVTQDTPAIARDKESIPEYVDKNFKTLILLEYGRALDSLNKKSTEKDLKYYRAWCHYINGQMFNAFEEINEYLRLSSSNKYFGQILYAKIQFARINSHQSIEGLDNAISIDPTLPYAYLEKSKIYALTRNLGEGSIFINKCIRKFPDEKRFYLNRAILFTDSSPKKAIGDFNTFLVSVSNKDSSDLILGYFGLGKSYLKINDLSNALAQANAGLQLFPEYSPGYGLRGEINFRLKNYESALNDFKKFEEKLLATRYWKMMARIYEDKGEIEMACGYYNEHCKLLQDTETCSKLRKLKCKN